MQEIYVIEDLDQFINFARVMVFTSFGQPAAIDIDKIDGPTKEEQKRLDHLLSYNESLLIAKQVLKKERNKKTKELRYFMTSEIYNDFLQKLNSRLVSNILNILTNKGMIETCFDDTKDDWMFYIADKTDDKKQELPETD